MREHTGPGDVLVDRYRLTDLLTESEGGKFWRAFDSVLQRDVAVHIIGCEDDRAPLLREAAPPPSTPPAPRVLLGGPPYEGPGPRLPGYEGGGGAPPPPQDPPRGPPPPPWKAPH